MFLKCRADDRFISLLRRWLQRSICNVLTSSSSWCVSEALDGNLQFRIGLNAIIYSVSENYNSTDSMRLFWCNSIIRLLTVQSFVRSQLETEFIYSAGCHYKIAKSKSKSSRSNVFPIFFHLITIIIYIIKIYRRFLTNHSFSPNLNLS